MHCARKEVLMKMTLNSAFAAVMAVVCFVPATIVAAGPSKEFLDSRTIPTDIPQLLEYIRKCTGNDTDAQSVQKLIADLGNANFGRREQASRKLETLGPKALPELQKLPANADREVVTRANACVTAIRANWKPGVRLAVVRRLLAEGEGAAVVSTLFRFLPHAADSKLEEEICFGIYDRVKKDPRLLPVCMEALDNPLPERRALSALLTARFGDANQRNKARKSLSDLAPDVRLRAAQGFLVARDSSGVTALIDLLQEPAVELCWQAEELLHWVAGDDAPAEKVGEATEESRTKAASAWKTWWQANQKIDLTMAKYDFSRPGLLLLIERPKSQPGDERGSNKDRVLLCGCDGLPRWQLEAGHMLHDAHLLAGNRVVMLGNQEIDVPLSIRELGGKMLWKPTITLALQRPDLLTLPPQTCTPLPDGGYLIAISMGEVYQVEGDGKIKSFVKRFPLGDFRFRCSHIVDYERVLCFEPHIQRALLIVEFDLTGTRQLTQLSSADPAVVNARVDVERSPDGGYLVLSHRNHHVLKVNDQGKVVHRYERFPATNCLTMLPGGNFLIDVPVHKGDDQGTAFVELTPAGNVHAMVHSATAAKRSRVCLPLVRLGFEPKDDTLDLATSVAFLSQQLKSSNPVVRRTTAYFLQTYAAKTAASMLPEILKSLDDPEANRGGLASVLAKLPAADFPTLVAAAKDDRPKLRAAALYALSRLSKNTDEVLPILVQALEDKDQHVRTYSLQAVRNHLTFCKEAKIPLRQHHVEQIVVMLCKALPISDQDKISEDVSVIYVVRNILSEIGASATAVIPGLINTVKRHPNPEGRLLALSAVGAIGPNAKASVSTLCEVLANDKAGRDLRCGAAIALGKIGPNAKEALPFLVRALADSNEDVRYFAELSIHKIKK